MIDYGPAGTTFAVDGRSRTPETPSPGRTDQTVGPLPEASPQCGRTARRSALGGRRQRREGRSRHRQRLGACPGESAPRSRWGCAAGTGHVQRGDQCAQPVPRGTVSLHLDPSGVRGVRESTNGPAVRVGSQVDKRPDGGHGQRSDAQRARLKRGHQSVVVIPAAWIQADQGVDLCVGQEAVGQLGRRCGGFVHPAAPTCNDSTNAVQHNRPDRHAPSAERLPRKL